MAGFQQSIMDQVNVGTAEVQKSVDGDLNGGQVPLPLELRLDNDQDLLPLQIEKDDNKVLLHLEVQEDGDQVPLLLEVQDPILVHPGHHAHQVAHAAGHHIAQDVVALE